jgi:ABC-type transporter Mla subunit MlaD
MEENKGLNSDTSGMAGAAARAKDQVAGTLSDAKDKVAELGRQSVDKLNDSRESAAGALEKTASSLHSSGDSVSGFAHSTADSLQATADYVRRTDLKGMGEDVVEIVKRYPGQALAAAAVLGFLVARGLGGRD